MDSCRDLVCVVWYSGVDDNVDDNVDNVDSLNNAGVDKVDVERSEGKVWSRSARDISRREVVEIIVLFSLLIDLL